MAAELGHTPLQVAEEGTSLRWDTDMHGSVIRPQAVISNLQTPHCFLFYPRKPPCPGKKSAK